MTDRLKAILGWRWGLRGRIVARTIAVLGVSLAAAFVWSAFNLRAVLQDRNDAFLWHEFSEFSAALSENLEEDDRDRALEAVRHVARAAKEEGFYVLLSHDGSTEALTEGAAAAHFQSAALVAQLDEAPRTVEVPGDPVGVRAIRAALPVQNAGTWFLVLGLPLAETAHTRAMFNLRLATGGVLFLVLALVGGLFLARQAIQPVSDSITAVRCLNPADLSARLPRTGIGDELDCLAETVNDLLERLAQYHKQMIRFTADASHELRGPLAAIRAAIEITLQRPRSATDYQELLSATGEQCQRLTDLVNDLLLLARADAGQVELHFTPLDLTEVVSEAVETYRPLAEEKGVLLEAHVPARSFCRGDRMRLLQLTMNLVDNAIKFTPVAGSVRVCVEAAGAAALLTIEDTGIGIPADRLPHVFERFYQVDESRSSEGAGLGLSICRWVAAAHGGTINAESQMGAGTRVRVTIPGAEARPTELRSAQPEASTA